MQLSYLSQKLLLWTHFPLDKFELICMLVFRSILLVQQKNQNLHFLNGKLLTFSLTFSSHQLVLMLFQKRIRPHRFGCLTEILKNKTFFPKLFWPSVRKKCSSDREKLQKFKNLQKKIRSLEQLIQTMKGQNFIRIGKINWDLEICRKVRKCALCHWNLFL